MKKTKNFLIILFSVILLVLCISSICYADNGLTIESFEVTAPNPGVYGVGTELQFTMKFNKKIKGTLPKLQIYIGTEQIELDEVVLSDYSDTAIFKYTIKSGDNGELDSMGRFVDGEDGYEYKLEGEDEKIYIMDMPLTSDMFKNTIYVDTTIERANFSNAEYKWDVESTDKHYGLRVKISNVNLIENNNYWIHFSHDKEENNSIFDLENEDKWKILYGSISYSLDNIIAEKGDIYVWICERDKQYRVPKIVVNGEKIERLEQLPLGSRLRAYFFDDYTSTYCWETIGDNEDNRKMNVKIGTISDINILKSIKNGEKDSLEKLLTYAKSAESIFTITIPIGRSDELMSKMNLLNKNYYYVYMEIEDKNGKYYPIEDVSLYQATVSSNVKMLCDYLDSNFKWNLSEEAPKNSEPEPKIQNDEQNTKDDTIAKSPYPNTGIEIFATVIIGIVVFSIIKFIRYRNLKDIK